MVDGDRDLVAVHRWDRRSRWLRRVFAQPIRGIDACLEGVPRLPQSDAHRLARVSDQKVGALEPFDLPRRISHALEALTQVLGITLVGTYPREHLNSFPVFTLGPTYLADAAGERVSRCAQRKPR